MTTIPGEAAQGRAPRHLWIVGGLSLAWNALGCLDFVMSNLREPAYVVHLPPGMIDWIDALPAWAIMAWGGAVGFALLGSLLLLGRSLGAAYAFAFSLLSLAASQAYPFATGLPPALDTVGMWALTAALWIVTVVQLLYAIRMRIRRVLR